MWSMPAPSASSMMIWIAGVSPIGISSLGTALVAGRNRVPIPAAGMTALRTCMGRTISLAGHRSDTPGCPPRHVGVRRFADIFRPCHAHVRVQVRRDRRDDRSPAVVQRRHAHRDRPPRDRRRPCRSRRCSSRSESRSRATASTRPTVGRRAAKGRRGQPLDPSDSSVSESSSSDRQVHRSLVRLVQRLDVVEHFVVRLVVRLVVTARRRARRRAPSGD